MKPRIGITSSPTIYDERRIDRVSRWYVDAVVRAGGLPLILPTLAPEDAAETMAGLDGLLLTGGGDVDPARYHQAPAPEVYDVDPARDDWELALVEAAGGLPILGVCRGCQLLNVSAGGSLIQHLPNVTSENHRQRERDRDEVHRVDVAPDSRLAAVLGATRVGVNTVHHQAVDRVGDGWRPVAWAPDRNIEAIEPVGEAPVIAVQWHPESLIDLDRHGQLFLWLTRAAAGHHPGLDLPTQFLASSTAPITAGVGHLVDDVA